MTQTAKPKRRWFQYSLRTLLLFVFLVSIPLSWFAVVVQNVRRQREAVVEIEQVGGYVVHDCFGNVVHAIVNRTKGEKTGLAHIGTLSQLELLDLTGFRMTDANLADLRQMTHLKWLWLDCTNTSDAGLEHLKGLIRLQSLGLRGNQITDAGLEHLKRSRELRYVNLAGTKVTEQGVESLQEALPYCQISH